MTKKHEFQPGDGPFRFRVKLEGVQGMDTAALRPPFDVANVFGTKARVPVRGTVNGYPFRSSLCNMGDGHMMVINKQMRHGANCKAGDIVDIVLQRDREERVIEIPTEMLEVIASNKTAQSTWNSLSYTHKKEWVRAIGEAKHQETKNARMKKMMDVLKAGKRVGF